MNVIKFDSNKEKFNSFFKKLLTLNSPILSWQLIPETGQRKISESTLFKFLPEENELHFKFHDDSQHSKDLPFYFYSEKDDFIFKTTAKSFGNSFVALNIPKEIQFLEGQKINLNLSLSIKSMTERSQRDKDYLTKEFELPTLDEEDRLFADKRESPRAKPKVEKWVKIEKSGERLISVFKLYDLSRGGISFIAIGNEEFPIGTSINVKGFDEFDLDDPLTGVVMSSRPVDEFMVEYKVGVKFNEGQN